MFVIKDKTNNKFLYEKNLLPKLENSVNETQSGKKALDAHQGKVLNDKIVELNGDIANRVAKAQGVENSGKYLKVNASGTVECAEVGNTDVQINGTSITENGVANVPVATSSRFGVIKTGTGLTNTNGVTSVTYAGNSDVSSRYSGYAFIRPSNMDVFVRTALCDGKGQAYTEDEKASARARLGALGSEYQLIHDSLSEEATSKLIVDLGGVYTDLVLFVFVPARTVAGVVRIGVRDDGERESMLTYVNHTINYAYHYIFPVVKYMKNSAHNREIVGVYQYSAASAFAQNGGYNQASAYGFYSADYNINNGIKYIVVADNTNTDLILAGTRVIVMARGEA